MTDTDFASLPLDAATLANLASLGFTAMTPIQARSLPVILEGRDVLAQAGVRLGVSYPHRIVSDLQVARRATVRALLATRAAALERDAIVPTHVRKTFCASATRGRHRLDEARATRPRGGAARPSTYCG